MKECGVVVEVIGSNAVVNIKRKSACGSCKACEMGKSDAKEMNVVAKNEVGAEVNDNVNIILDTPDVLRAAIIVYLIPLIALVLGVGIGTIIAKSIGLSSDWIGLVVGLIFLGIAYIYVKKQDKKLAATKKYEPIITEVLGKNII